MDGNGKIEIDDFIRNLQLLAFLTRHYMEDRFIEEASEKPISFVHMNLLRILDSNPGQTVGDIAKFIADELGVDTPWHVSRFYPTYKLIDRPPTPVDTLRRARQIGLAAGLRYVYEGNVPGDGGEDTLCPQCGKVIIRRTGYTILSRDIREGACAYCGARIDGIGL